MLSSQNPIGPQPGSSGPPEADRDRLFTLSLDLLCIAGLDGYFKQVNPSWTRVLGWSREELLARPVADFIHPDDRERTLQARADLARGIPVNGLENRYLCKDGSHRWLSWQSTVEPGAATVFAVARDVTERRQQDHERMVLGKLESTGILAGGIAHDFNNLLASLQLNTELLALYGGVNARQKQLLAQNLETIRSAESLTQKLLTFARGGRMDRKTIDLKRLLVESMDLALSGSNIRGESRIPPELRPVHADEAQISQVVRNLILNAREAMPGGGTVRLHAENVSLSDAPGAEHAADGYVRISVVDEGSGIPEEILPKVFDPYFSTKQRGTQKGMGLGLTICHSIIQKNGGAMTVDSRPGRGTTVCFLLPAATASVPSPAASPPAAPVAGRKILVMDDEAPLREIMTQTLIHLGCTVEAAKDGEDAIALFIQARDAGAPFAAALLDLTVRGGMGGAETIKKLRDLDPAVRAILMTGYDHEQTFRDHVKHGFLCALPKPFTLARLRATLAEVLGGAA